MVSELRSSNGRPGAGANNGRVYDMELYAITIGDVLG